MKNILFLALIAAVSQFVGCTKDKEEVLNESQIPSEIKAYVDQHFTGKQIIKCVKETEHKQESYDVTISDNFKLEFEGTFEVKEVKGVTRLPDSVVPAKLLEYVNTNYPTNHILKWEKEATEQELKIDSGIELIFDLNGEFLRIDG